MSDNYFQKLNGIDVSGKTEKKGNLTYLSWAWAWAEVKKLFPDTTYKVYENEAGWCYFTDGRTGWVKTGVTINGIEHIEYLPIMDQRNRSIPLDNITSFDVNKTIQRSLTKACARHGLGLYIYAGEDLPEGDKPEPKEAPKEAPKEEIRCECCGEVVQPFVKSNGTELSPEKIAAMSRKKYGKVLCVACATAANES